MSDNKEFELTNLDLGKPTEYLANYSPELLQGVPRALNRQELGIVDQQPFFGVDIWHGYELSWLNSKGKPVVALMRCSVPFDTPNIIESKSFKLYLNSFNQSHFDSSKIVIEHLERDLSATAGGQVFVELIAPDDISCLVTSTLPGKNLDNLDIEVDQYQLAPELLQMATGNGTHVEETVHSHLLKSNCLITNQPDWASVVIDYRGTPIDHSSLLKYLISFRMHNEFHEQCVERIFVDLMRAFELENLTVQALYTRRGGLDICPLRSSYKNAYDDNSNGYHSNGKVWRVNRQ